MPAMALVRGANGNRDAWKPFFRLRDTGLLKALKLLIGKAYSICWEYKVQTVYENNLISHKSPVNPHIVG